MSPVLAGRFFSTVLPGKPMFCFFKPPSKNNVRSHGPQSAGPCYKATESLKVFREGLWSILGHVLKDHSGYSVGKMLVIKQSRSKEFILFSHIKVLPRMGKKCPDGGSLQQEGMGALGCDTGQVGRASEGAPPGVQLTHKF